MPRIFIAYSHDSPTHAARALGLAQRLREAGLDAWIDQFEVEPAEGWPLWMQREVERADHVLLVCTDTWRRRFERPEAPDVGRGATWEGHLATLMLYHTGGSSPKFIPVRFADTDAEAVPAILDASTACVLDEDWSRLLTRLDRPTDPRPQPAVERRSAGLPDELAERDVLGMLHGLRRALAATGRDTTAIDDQLTTQKRRLKLGYVLQPGDCPAGRYALLRHLGHGGFGTVWMATDLATGDPVAVKLLHSELQTEPNDRARFFRGARCMQELKHPAVVPVLDIVGLDEPRTTALFAMAYMRGGDLDRAVRTRQLGGIEAIAALLPIAEALEQAHARRILHRDLKPQNALIDGDGALRLSDFDLVKVGGATGLTQTGRLLGSLLYAAPEQRREATSVDARADVYGLAMTMVFCLRGSDPPEGVLFDPQAALVDVDAPAPLVDALRAGIAQDPARRTPTMARLRAAVADALPPPYEAPEGHRSRRAPWVSAGGVALAGADDSATSTQLLKLVDIPAGEFLMGRPARPDSASVDAAATGPDELPRHRVAISAFRLAVHPVTQAQYLTVMGTNPAQHRGEDLPVDTVSWLDAVAFCNALSRSEQRPELYRRDGETWICDWQAAGYRLPTEAEWEYACRAGTTTAFSSGDTEADLSRVGWFRGNSGDKTHPVGGKPANPWGLYDMHGNVCEWCWDGSDSYGKPPALTRDPRGPLRGDARVLRGGFVWSSAALCRSASRSRGGPADRSSGIGFRVVLGGAVLSGH